MITALIDCNTILRTRLNSILTNHFPNMLILDAESVESFHQHNSNLQPDLAVFAQQTETDIVADILKFKEYYKPEAIIVYNVIFDVKVIRHYFKIRVTGCISRKANESELISCVQDAVDGKRHIGPDFHELILTEVFSKSKFAKSRHNTILSAREFEIALHLCEGQKNSWIAKKLERKPSTISTIKKNIFNKLQIDNIVDLKKIIKKV